MHEGGREGGREEGREEGREGKRNKGKEGENGKGRREGGKVRVMERKGKENELTDAAVAECGRFSREGEALSLEENTAVSHRVHLE